MNEDINNSEDILNSRDIQGRISDLESFAERDDWEQEELDILLKLKGAVDEFAWNDGITFIRDSYFEEDTEEFVYDIGMVERDASIVPYVDWSGFADSRKMDFGEVDFDGVTYWYQQY